MLHRVLFILFCILSSTTKAQVFSLSGIVQLTDGRPVPYATVIIKSPARSVVSDESGKFVFESLRHGHYQIEVTSLEITSKVFNIIFETSRPVILTVEPSAARDLKEVTVTHKTEKTQIETRGFAVNTIETQKVAMQSIQTNELLDRSAGVRIRQDGGLGSNINYNINGLSGNAVRIFIDGVPSSNFGSAFSLNSIPPALIERIEVYKGVVPGHLSQDALGGAINIVLKKQSRNTLVTSYSAGSFNTHQWNMAGTYRKDNGLTIDGSAFYNYSDNSYKVWGRSIAFKDYTGATYPNQRAKRFHDAYRSYGARLELGFTDVKWADRFLVGGILSRDYKEIQHGITMDIVYGDRHTRRTSEIATLTYSKKDFLTRGLAVKANASYSYLKRQAIDTVGIMYDWSGNPLRYPDGSYIRYSSGAEIGNTKTLGINSDKTFVSQAGASYSFNTRHTLHANYLYNNFVRGISDVLQPAGLQKLANTRDLQKNVISFTYENLSFSDKLRTNLFYKHYFQKVTSNEPYINGQINGEPDYRMRKLVQNIGHSGYGITFSYELNPKLFLLGSGERAVRLPNANELFGNVNDNILPPSGSLNPEISTNANIGFNWRGYTFRKHTVRLNTSLFYRDTKGMIRESIRAGSFVYSQFENLEDVLTKGVDAEVFYSYASRLDLSFNISKFNVLFNTEFDANGAPYLFYRMQIRNEPSFKYNLNAAWYHKDLFLKGSRGSVFYNINYVKGFLRNWSNIGGRNLDYIPTQFSNDIGFAYTLPSQKLTLSLDGKNIFNQQIFDNFGLQKPGRAFYAKITYTVY